MDRTLVLTRASETAADDSSWRTKGVGVLRILFGGVMGIDAWFKWQPAFIQNFTDQFSHHPPGAAMPGWIQAWINLWLKIVQLNPHLFAYAVAVGETAVALGLILGLLSNLTDVVGAVLLALIWSTVEGFGAPYGAGSTDIGTAIIYIPVFATLFLNRAGLVLGLDRHVGPLLGRWSFLASGPVETGPA